MCLGECACVCSFEARLDGVVSTFAEPFDLVHSDTCVAEEVEDGVEFDDAAE